MRQGEELKAAVGGCEGCEAEVQYFGVGRKSWQVVELVGTIALEEETERRDSRAASAGRLEVRDRPRFPSQKSKNSPWGALRGGECGVLGSWHCAQPFAETFSSLPTAADLPARISCSAQAAMPGLGKA